MVAQRCKIFFFARLPYCAVEFPSADADADVVEADSVFAVHVVESYERRVFFEQFEGFEFG